MSDAILVINAGSSSVKFALFDDSSAGVMPAHGRFEGLPGAVRFAVSDADGMPLDHDARFGDGPTTHATVIEFLLNWLHDGPLAQWRLVAAGHRVVHGGSEFVAPTRIDAQVMRRLHALESVAPLHQPHNLAAIDAVAGLAADLPQVACFDTAFHATQPAVARRLPLPRRFHDAGVQRYGFHGLSYEYVASVLPELDERAATGRTVVAHLGAGASLCAMRHGRSIATTMGFTALDGLMMGTRTGALDPGVLLYLMDRYAMRPRELESLLYRESGLLGVSGISSDMRALLDCSDERAAEAVELYVYRISRELGALAATLCGLDALIFTGGVGERSSEIRAQVCRAAGWLGVELDESANAAGGPRISTTASRVGCWALHTNEELMIARHTHRVLARD